MKRAFSEQTTVWILFELVSQVKPLLATAAEQHNLTLPQFHLLGCLYITNEPQPMSSLAHVMSCDASNVTGLIDRMVAVGLVERVEHPKDRRVKLIRITNEGTVVYTETLAVASKSVDDQIHSALTKEEHEAFRSLIVKMLERTA